MPLYARGNPARWWISRSCGGVSRAPASLFISPFRRYATRITLGGLILFFGGVWYVTNPARISRLSEVLLSRVLGGHVTVRSGRLSFTGTLLLGGVDVRTADPEPTPAGDVPIFSAEQIEVRFDWTSLLSGQLSATQLVATKPVFRPIEDRETGHWNYERLRPRGAGRFATTAPADGTIRYMALPVVIIRDATVEWGEVHGSGGARVIQTAETHIDGQLTPDASLPSTYRLQFAQSAPSIDAHGPETRADIGFTLSGTWDVARDVFSASTEDVVLSEALKRGMPRQARQWCDEHQLSGRLAQMKITFSQPEGLTLSVRFDGVSMMWMVEPENGIGMGEVRPAYPLTVSNVRGSVTFSTSDGSMKVNDLRGEVLGYPFVANCTVRGASFEAPYELNLRFPGAVLGDRYPSLFMAFLTSQDLIQRVQPHGKVDISLILKREVQRGPLLVDGTIDCHDVRIRFAHLPYPLEKMNGRVTFHEDSVTFHDVTARSEDSVVHIRGTMGTHWTNPMIDFEVSSDRVDFDDRLGACLPEKFSQIWDLFSIRGTGSFNCRVVRSRSFFDQPKVSLDIAVQDASGYIRDMPYVFSNAHGRLHLDGQGATIDQLTATAGADHSGRVALSGVVRYSAGDVVDLRPDLKIQADLPIEDSLINAIPDEIAASFKKMKLEGRIGFNGTVRGQPDPQKPGSPEAVRLAGAFLWSHGALHTHFGDSETPLDLSDVSAEARVSADGIELRRFAGDMLVPGTTNDIFHLGVTGHLDPATASASLKLTADADALALPHDPPDLLPADWRDAWKTNAPMGQVGVKASADVRINPPVTNASQPATQDADAKPLVAASRPDQTNSKGGAQQIVLDSYDILLSPRDISFKPADWPDPIEHLKGDVQLQPGHLGMSNMTAKLGSVDLAWNGNMQLASGKTEFSGDVTSHGIPIKWLTWLPEFLRQDLDAKRDGTVFSLHFNQLARETAAAPWHFDGRLEAHDLGLTAPVPMNIERAALVAQGTYLSSAGKTPAALDFNGVMAGAGLTLHGHPIDTLTSRVDVLSATNAIHFSEINGKAAEGSLRGRLDVYTASMPLNTAAASQPTAETVHGAGGYLADFSLKDAQLSQLLMTPDTKPEDVKQIGTGKVAATLQLLETFGPGGERTGQGQLNVTEANIYNIPLAMGLMQMVTFRLPVAQSFRQASMNYSIRNNDINFERILLESKGIDLAGTGTVSIKSQTMDLNFLTETPNEVFIPILSPIIRETRNELLQLSVTGTIDKPKVTPVPLSAIANTLRAILPHSQPDDTH
jgi:hypothetical protein